MLAGKILEEGDQVSEKQQEQDQNKKEIKVVKDIKQTLQNSQLQDSKYIPQTPVQSLQKSDTNFLKRKGGQINLPQAKKRDTHQTPINERLNQSSGRYGLNYSFSKNQDKWELEKLKAKNDFDCQGCGNWLKAKQYAILFLACQHKYHSQCVQNIYQNRLNETYEDYLQKSQSKCPKCAKNQNDQSELQSQCSIAQNECRQSQILEQNSLNRSIIKKEGYQQENLTVCKQSQKNEETPDFQSDAEINFQNQNQQKVIQILEASCESQNSLDSVSANCIEEDQINLAIQGENAQSKEQQQKKDNLNQNSECKQIIPLIQISKASEEEQAQLKKCEDVYLEYQEIDKDKRQIKRKEKNFRVKKEETEDSPQQTKHQCLI